jgi:glycosyltransferase involved in cell wall biosynthesis
MKIHLYAVAWNEEFMMPFFMRHYAKFCEKIIIYDNESTDGTAEIVEKMGGEIRTWSSNNKLDDSMYLEIKNNAYKKSRGSADWVIVCDSDEFIYHPNLVNLLSEYKSMGINFPKTEGYEMIPNCFIEKDCDLVDNYKYGSRYVNLDKRAIFNPNLEIKYGPGCHSSNTPELAVQSENADIKILHYKYLNPNYLILRHKLLGSRLSDSNIQHNWGVQYTWNEEIMKKRYNEILSIRSKVI